MRKTESFLTLIVVRQRFAPAPRGGLRSPEATTCLSPYSGRINPTTDSAPVSITQTRRPNIHRLGAGKNARAPTTALDEPPAGGSGAVLGRINPTPRSHTSFDHPNPAPERSPAGDPQTTCLALYWRPCWIRVGGKRHALNQFICRQVWPEGAIGLKKLARPGCLV
ncbi:MAG: hypothetical protein GX456_00720 [Verrucomicrobia bacterium]|nr:hypothetical protein [Verrucomicrobiota bacterium]